MNVVRYGNTGKCCASMVWPAVWPTAPYMPLSSAPRHDERVREHDHGISQGVKVIRLAAIVAIQQKPNPRNRSFAFSRKLGD
eukprot:6616923-Pyramimonas_sp.AAC.1